jgi:hypothetical protein
MLNKKNKNFIIYPIFLIICYHYFNDNFILLNSDIENVKNIIIIIEKFLNPKSIPILTESEKAIAIFWNQELICPFSKLISHGLTKEEALLIIDFFKIEKIEDLIRLEEFLKKYK